LAVTAGGLGYDVLEAGGGDEALNRLKDHQTIRLLLILTLRAALRAASRRILLRAGWFETRRACAPLLTMRLAEESSS
jgi:hypothetical protein